MGKWKGATQLKLPTPVCIHYSAWTDHTLLHLEVKRSRTTSLWHLQATCLS